MNTQRYHREGDCVHESCKQYAHDGGYDFDSGFRSLPHQPQTFSNPKARSESL